VQVDAMYLDDLDLDTAPRENIGARQGQMAQQWLDNYRAGLDGNEVYERVAQSQTEPESQMEQKTYTWVKPNTLTEPRSQEAVQIQGPIQADGWQAYNPTQWEHGATDEDCDEATKQLIINMLVEDAAVFEALNDVGVNTPSEEEEDEVPLQWGRPAAEARNEEYADTSSKPSFLHEDSKEGMNKEEAELYYDTGEPEHVQFARVRAEKKKRALEDIKKRIAKSKAQQPKLLDETQTEQEKPVDGNRKKRSSESDLWDESRGPKRFERDSTPAPNAELELQNLFATLPENEVVLSEDGVFVQRQLLESIAQQHREAQKGIDWEARAREMSEEERGRGAPDELNEKKKREEAAAKQRINQEGEGQITLGDDVAKIMENFGEDEEDVYAVLLRRVRNAMR